MFFKIVLQITVGEHLRAQHQQRIIQQRQQQQHLLHDTQQRTQVYTQERQDVCNAQKDTMRPAQTLASLLEGDTTIEYSQESNLNAPERCVLCFI